jgi:hypothetical protein
MEHGAIDHTNAAIGGAAAARIEIKVERADRPSGS